MHIEEKKKVVDELHEIANRATSAIAADYHGTSVIELTQLREDARDSFVHLKVIRNTLAKKALIDTKYSCLDGLLVGPTILAFSLKDSTSAAKLANDFHKINANFKVKGLSMGDVLMDISRLAEIANLPSKDEAIAKLAGTINLPLIKLTSIINEIPTKLVRTLDALKQQRQKGDS